MHDDMANVGDAQAERGDRDTIAARPEQAGRGRRGLAVHNFQPAEASGLGYIPTP